ncbi:hypothetical protein CEXT_137631 [Caerostris extrusa]|uniref:Secreted protein n=1 Tax=Caerostris extrusa TaxID=172846 RepID=A0AAV4Y6N6_CAEEX|nr:hypothetical protein CEXT_137631 [Caerostris extrusa]
MSFFLTVPAIPTLFFLSADRLELKVTANSKKKSSHRETLPPLHASFGSCGTVFRQRESSPEANRLFTDLFEEQQLRF